MDVVITRCSNNYGPLQYPEKLIPLAIQRLKEGKKVPVYGQGTNIRDWIYVDEETDILHWCDSKLPFAMCEFNLTARYVLEPEPRKPVEVTEESFDAAWQKAATEQQNTDRPFRECLKEALMKAR